MPEPAPTLATTGSYSPSSTGRIRQESRCGNLEQTLTGPTRGVALRPRLDVGVYPHYWNHICALAARVGQPIKATYRPGAYRVQPRANWSQPLVQPRGLAAVTCHRTSLPEGPAPRLRAGPGPSRYR